MPSNQTKKPTRDDLMMAAQAALKSGDPDSLADAADAFANAAEVGVDNSVSSVPSYRVRGTRDWSGPPSVGRTQTRDRNENRGQQEPAGPAALATGHGMARGGGQRRQENEPSAYEEFMAALETALDRVADRIQVSERKGWIKIESLVNGHKVYIAKSKTAVSRIESTIPANRIKGAAEPDRANGRISSWIPADPNLVAQAIEILASEEEQIRPPQRGGGDTQVEQGQDQGQGQERGGNKARFHRAWGVRSGGGSSRR
jgi:hypothetical protein